MKGIDMKKSMDWHKECLKNKDCVIRLKEEYEEKKMIYIRAKEEYEVGLAQYELAVKEKKDGYDADKYGKGRIVVKHEIGGE